MLHARLFSLQVSPRVFCVCTRACRAAASLVRAAPTEPVLTDNTAYCSDASFCTCASESPVSRAIFSTLNPSASILRAACSICLFIICRTIIKHRMRAVVIAAVYSISVPRANLRLYNKQKICRLSDMNFADGQRRTCRLQIFSLPSANETFAIGKCPAGRRQISYRIIGKFFICHRQIVIF